MAAVLWITGCSLADFDALSRGHGKGSAGAINGNGGAAGRYGSSTSAGATAMPSGGTEAGEGGATAGTGAVAGEAGVDAVVGGSGAGAGAETAGAAGVAGRSGDGSAGSDASAGTAGTSQSTSCPTADGTGGVLVTPPSNDFESNINQWTKLSSASGLSRPDGDGSACSGTAYLSCYGASRQAGWDGPSITLTPYLVSGHSYSLNLAVRFNKSTAPASERAIGLTAITVCDGSTTPVYTSYRKVLTTTNWARLMSSQPLVVPPAGCNGLVYAAVYVETEEADAARSIDVDDFRLIDLTNPASSGGGTANANLAGSAPANASAGYAGGGRSGG